MFLENVCTWHTVLWSLQSLLWCGAKYEQTLTFSKYQEIYVIHIWQTTECGINNKIMYSKKDARHNLINLQVLFVFHFLSNIFATN